jgi:predicted HicB family RNase H-like nuclease
LNLCYHLPEGGDTMSISPDKVRANLVILKTLKAELEELAKADGRSFNNYIIKVLQDHVDAKKAGSR